LREVFNGTVARSESLRPGLVHPGLTNAGNGWEIARWLDHLETAAQPELVAQDGAIASYRQGAVRYLAAWPQGIFIDEVITLAARDAGLEMFRLPEGMRMRSTSAYRFVFNYSAEAQVLPASVTGDILLGGPTLEPGEVTVSSAA
jgi:beta-galactosidase